jgi:thymidine kinase
MGSGKSTEIQRTIYQYQSKGFPVLTLKPSFDNRDGKNVIFSRQTGEKVPCMNLEDYITDDLEETYKRVKNYHIILVDEVQFCTPEQIYMLDKLAKEKDVRVVTYGLYKDFKDEFFPATEILDKIAGEKTVIKGVCECCGGGATHNVRLDSHGRIITEGEQNVLGGTESGLPTYITLCDEDYLKRDIGPTLRKEFNDYWSRKKYEQINNDQIIMERVEKIIKEYASLDSFDDQRALRQYMQNFVRGKDINKILDVTLIRMCLEYIRPRHKILNDKEQAVINEFMRLFSKSIKENQEGFPQFIKFDYKLAPYAKFAEGQNAITYICTANDYSHLENPLSFELYGFIDKDGYPNLMNSSGVKITDTSCEASIQNFRIAALDVLVKDVNEIV